MHNSKKSSIFAGRKERTMTMDENVFVQFKTEEERQAALRKMVGLRKEFEARVREIMAKRKGVQIVQ